MCHLVLLFNTSQMNPLFFCLSSHLEQLPSLIWVTTPSAMWSSLFLLRVCNQPPGDTDHTQFTYDYSPTKTLHRGPWSLGYNKHFSAFTSQGTLLSFSVFSVVSSHLAAHSPDRNVERRSPPQKCHFLSSPQASAPAMP